MRVDRLSMGAVLLAGFGLVLCLGLLYGVLFARRMAEVQREAEGINRRYAHAQELLTTVRTQVLLGAIYVRDGLLDQTPGATSLYRRQLEAALDSATDALRRYELVVESKAVRTRMQQLAAQVADFRVTVLDVLGGDVPRLPREARMLLRSRIIPKREGVIAVFQEVEDLNRGAVAERQAATAAIYRAMERRVWAQLAVTLAAGFIIGYVATRRVEFLESRLQQEQRRDAESARDLHRLSSQLVTAQEDERRTIARELHDEVGQVLSAIKVELAVAQRSVDATGGPAHLLADARAITERALHTVRNISHLLHPAMLDDLGLAAAIEAHTREFRRRYDIPIEFVHERMDGRLPQSVELAAYRLIQEALSNVAKHAHASSCRVELLRFPESVRLAVEDDGVGFDPSGAGATGARDGLGLLGMRERVSQLRGSIRVDTWPGRGTKLSVVLPTTWPLGSASPAGQPADEAV